MVVERYTLVTTTGENYLVEKNTKCLPWLPYERFKFKVPLADGQVPHTHRYRQGKRTFRGNGAKNNEWYNLVGFLKDAVDYSGNIFDITGNRSLNIEDFTREASEGNGCPFSSISGIEDIGKLVGSRPWVVREGSTIVTPHCKILPVIADVLEGWTVKSD